MSGAVIVDSDFSACNLPDSETIRDSSDVLPFDDKTIPNCSHITPSKHGRFWLLETPRVLSSN
jgi:hypothetical protein